MLLICIQIFCARIVDVSIGTIRTVLTVKGKKYISAILAFFEVFIWFWVAREALNTEINSLWIPISYSLGYATGTLIGTYLANNVIKGFISIQVITESDNDLLINSLRSEGFGVSVVELKKEKDENKKDMLYVEIKKSSLKDATKIIRKYDPNAFVIINETKYVQNGLLK